MPTMEVLLREATEKGASDLHLSTGEPPMLRVHGDLAVATYRSTYDAMIQGQHYARTVLCTDTLQQQNGVWKLMAGHCSQAAK